MSLSSTLEIGTNGMRAQSTSMGIISDNIANSTTVGYKANVARFSEIIANPHTAPVGYQPSSVQAHPTPLITKAGLIQAVSSTTSAAIQGDGMFIVTPQADSDVATEAVFTRAGDWLPDQNGDLRNTSGYYLQGWPVNSDGTQDVAQTFDTMQPINLNIPQTAVSTTLVEVSANLNANQPFTLQSTLTNTGGNGLNSNAQAILGNHAGVTTPGTIDVNLGGANVGTLTVDGTTTLASLAADLNAIAGVTASTTTDANNNPVLTASSDNVLQDLRLTDSGGSDFIAGLFADADGDVIADDDGDPTTADVAGADGTTYDLTTTTGDMSAGLVTPDNTIAINVFDDTGASHTVDLNFKAVAHNQWAFELTSADADPGAHSNGFINGGFMTFRDDGSLEDITDAAGTSILGTANDSIQLVNNVTWANGSGPQQITYDFGSFGDVTVGMTQFAQLLEDDGTVPYITNFLAQDGSEASEFVYATISPDGFVNGVFKNGKDVPLYQIPLADFISINELEAESGNVYRITEGSGEAIIKTPGDNGAGLLAPQALENSNVELAEEFTTMIITQQAYSAASKVVSTADDMYQTLGQLK